jgi:formylglycine-generating enzyme required for sulfatase activity
MLDTVEVFISYSKQDKELRDGLLAHLRPLETRGVLTWYDRQILPGTRWDDEIKARLNAADIILLLISADFLATDYCTQVEIPEALRRHQADEAIVMPVILRACGWQYTPLADIQAYPEKAKPIRSWTDIDEAYTDVVRGVYLAATEIKKRRSQRPVGQARQQPATETEQIEDLDNDTKLEIVRIAGKRFLMGSPDNEVDRQEDEGPQHRVEIRSFGMGKYPVTQEQWWVVATKFPKIKRDLEPEPSAFKGDRLPVECVSWYDAIEFCDRLFQKTKKIYRLPSEAEWEYACRAGTTAPFHFGETIATDLANFNQKYGGTTEVSKFQPNASGLYDMHGNVWEWCADHWHENYKGAPTNGSAWLTDNQGAGRLMRGGSWFDYPSYCRSACRGYFGADVRDGDLGFRVVCVLA